MAKFAVILAGSGVFDGSEIQEAVSTLIAIKKHGGDYICFAPNRKQTQTINHLTGKLTSEERNILIEAARIARGEIHPLEDYSPDDFDAVIFPGGFGVAKNFFTFAFDGKDCSIESDIVSVIVKTHNAGKYIGAMCVAPGLIVRAFKGSDKHITVTGGNEIPLCEMIDYIGGKNVHCDVTMCVIDEGNRIVSTPAYTSANHPWEVFQGVEALIKAIVERL
jgi:enhancing lycopene biosynthesis protein 2